MALIALEFCIPNTRIQELGLACTAASILSLIMGVAIIAGVIFVLWFFFGRKDPEKELRESYERYGKANHPMEGQ